MFDEKGVVITETLLKLPKQTIALSGITSVRSGSNPMYPEASGSMVQFFIASFTFLESFFFLVKLIFIKLYYNYLLNPNTPVKKEDN